MSRFSGGNYFGFNVRTYHSGLTLTWGDVCAGRLHVDSIRTPRSFPFPWSRVLVGPGGPGCPVRPQRPWSIVCHSVTGESEPVDQEEVGVAIFTPL